MVIITKGRTLVDLGFVAALLISVALVGGYALGGGFDDWDTDGRGLPWNSSRDISGDPLSPGPDQPDRSPDGDSTGPGVPPNPSNGGPNARPDSGDDQQPGIVDGDQTDGKVKLAFVNYAYNAVAGSAAPSYDIMAYDTGRSNYQAYTGDLVLEAEITPAAGNVTAPAPVAGNGGLYTFNANFDRPGEYTLKVTPYDGSGNVIGDPAEVAVNVVTAQGAVTDIDSSASPQGNGTSFTTTVKVLQMDAKRQSVLTVSEIVVSVNGTEHGSRLSYPNTGVTVGSVTISSADAAPGEQYNIIVYSGDRVVAAAAGTVPR
ncbi:hypothetical protein [Methanomassiliicoccus luminyensis]|uniref:hypothetical protein n=1 Tax=Methanomassiliicoccus luminyensis TaxID=1080712 RepID=UPI00035D6F98|nr:hypothetical protein [Methanomassiliicoccus luminyensis]